MSSTVKKVESIEEDAVSTKGSSKRVRSNNRIVTKDDYSLFESLQSLQNDVSRVKFNETVELHVVLNIDKGQTVRGIAVLPNGIGKEVKVAAFVSEAKYDEARNAGADFYDVEQLLSQIQSGVIDFDCCVATPDMMPKISKVAKILGPKGLMPNPKLGTVTMDIAAAIGNAKAGQVEYRVDKTGVIHAPVGKIDFSAEQLSENIRFLVKEIQKARPEGSKGSYITSIHLSSTMGPGYKLKIEDILN